MTSVFKKLAAKYQALDNRVKSSFWFAFCNILQKGIALFTTPLFTRLMTPEEYGMYSNYLSWSSIITILATLNLFGNVYNNGMIKYPEKRYAFTAAMQGLSTCCTVLLFAVYLPFADFWNGVLRLNTIMVTVMFVELLFLPAFNFWLLRNRFDFKYKCITVVTVLLSLLHPTLGVIAIKISSHPVEARVITHGIVAVAVTLFLYIYHFARGKTFFNREMWGFALRFNLPLIPHYLSQMVLQQADRIMITNMVGEAQNAFYSVSYSISMIMMVFTNAINNTLVPHTYQTIKAGESERLRRQITRLVFIVALGCCTATLIAPELVLLFSTREYYDAIWVMPPVCMSVLFMFVYGVYANVEFYYESTGMIMLASCLCAALNVGLNYALIPVFGYHAAGYTTLACYLCLALCHYLMYRYTLRKNGVCRSYYDDKTILLVSLMSLAAMAGLTFTYFNSIVRYSVLGLALALALIFGKKILAVIRAK